MDTKELEKEMPHTWHLLKKMCDMVKAPYKIVNTPQWFAKYSWNEAQEKEFENYFVDYLYNNSDARKELMNFPRKNKKYLVVLTLIMGGKEMTTKYEFVDEKFVLVALFRYALTRHTYAVGIAIDNLKLNWDKLDETAKKNIIQEIKDYWEDVDQHSWGSFINWTEENKK